MEGGYPDCGNGWYSRKLPYDDWYALNKAYRTHMNYVENLTIVVSSILIAGLSYPGVTNIVAIIFCVSRVFYFIFSNRTFGFFISTTAMMVLVVLGFISVV